MNHQPFNSWIYDEDLSLEQEGALRQHVDSCSACQMEQIAWETVQQAMLSSKMVAPSVGFTQRWQDQLAARQIKEQKQQIRRFFLFTLLLSATIILAMGGAIFFSATPARVIVNSVSFLTDIVVNWNLFHHTLLSVGKFVHPAVPIVIAAVLSLILSGAIFLWIAAIYRIFTQGAKNYENNK